MTAKTSRGVEGLPSSAVSPTAVTWASQITTMLAGFCERAVIETLDARTGERERGGKGRSGEESSKKDKCVTM